MTGKSFINIRGIVFLTLFVSCTDSLKGRIYIEDKDPDEIVSELLDANKGDGQFYMNDIELHTKVGGRWKNVGRYSVYSNLADKYDDCDLWVEFDGPTRRMPVKTTDKAGYCFCVEMGTYNYF